MEMRLELCPTSNVHRSGMLSWGRVKEKMSDYIPPKPAKPSPEGTIRLLLLAWPWGLLPARCRTVQLLQGQGSEQGLCALSMRGNLQQWCPAPGSSGAQQHQG